MTLTQLSYIVAVDKYKNFGQAAESCSVTQPTLSMQVQKIEDEIGVLIFDRSHQPVKTTKIGQALVSQARIVLNESQHFSDLVKQSSGEVTGHVSLGVIPTLAPYLLPLFIKRMSTQFPELSIHIEELQTEQIIERMHNSTLDLGLLVTPVDDEKIVVNQLFYEPFMVYTSEENTLFQKSKVTQQDLNSNDLWLLTEGHCFRDQSLLICKNRKKTSDIKKNIKFESGSLETLRRMMDQENGFTLLPYLATLDLQNKKQLKEFIAPVPTREVSLVHSTHFKRMAVIDAFTDCIKKGLPKYIALTPNKNTQVIDLPMGHSKPN